MDSRGYKPKQHLIVGRENDTGKRRVFDTLTEAEVWEKSGKGYTYLETREEFRKLLHTPNKIIDAKNFGRPDILTALVRFSCGDANPDVVEILLKNLEVLSDYGEDFNLATGKNANLYIKRLSAIRASLIRDQQRPAELVDQWTAHSIRLPKKDRFGRECNHFVHYSNLVAGSSYSCHICGANFSWKQLAPLVEEFVRINGEISATTPNKMSVFQSLKSAITRR